MCEISAKGIRKSYGKTEALKGIDLNVDKGELFGVIGPDGAGKTSLIRILTTLILADEGQAEVDGLDVVSDYKKLRTRLGYMPGKFSLYGDLTVKENLELFASLFGTTIKANYDLIKDIYERLEPFESRRAAKLSGGMKQKLALCCALIHSPIALFLDEPTTGVDPSSRREFWDMLRKLKQRGITIFVSTAYMDEASRCDRIALMSEGTFLKTGTPEHIISEFGEELLAVRSDEMFRLLGDLRKIEGVRSCYTFGCFHHITTDDKTLADRLPAALSVDYHHKGVCVERIKASVEDCYMNLTLER